MTPEDLTENSLSQPGAGAGEGSWTRTNSAPEEPKAIYHDQEFPLYSLQNCGSRLSQELFSHNSRAVAPIAIADTAESHMTSEDSSEELRHPRLTNNANYKPPLNSTPQHDPILSKICEKYRITPILYTALFNDNPNDRHFILNLEKDLIEFIKAPASDSWRLNPLNSYYRLLTHQIAEYYTLGHILLKDACSMVIFKNNTSMVNNSKPIAADGLSVPSIGGESEQNAVEKLNRPKLADLPNELGEAYFSNSGPAVKKEEKKFKIMRKGSNVDPLASNVDALAEAPSTSSADPGLSKEERYQRARERIFENGDEEEEEEEEDREELNGNDSGYPMYPFQPSFYYPPQIPPHTAPVGQSKQFQYPPMVPPQFAYYPAAYSGYGYAYDTRPKRNGRRGSGRGGKPYYYYPQPPQTYPKNGSGGPQYYNGSGVLPGYPGLPVHPGSLPPYQADLERATEDIATLGIDSGQKHQSH
ncbi:unnamed protein product [Kuraishia capsulata CBS 1993]|uniref:R3H domain-containing protein n=1 Tax=Kuraishia capsulata CBS 1993 TaxID=1382522 RepID=W6MUV2_9ASCO|nr:uncharacterized protein KUCA_T00005554001 [Kuraishia capsulata CBS 1993]CDK29562.1 unnamed protein product [Kuraishia capsulata CBS 1993]